MAMKHQGDRSVKAARRNLPGRLAEVRGSRSQRGWARELGVFQQNVNRYELGTAPHVDSLIDIALQEGVRLDWLLLGRGPKMVEGRAPKG